VTARIRLQDIHLVRKIKKKEGKNKKKKIWSHKLGFVRQILSLGDKLK
jgi:hypothetical protein